MKFHAHSGNQQDKSDWQPLRDHSESVAALAASFAELLGLERAAYFAGLLHDLGKYNPAFQEKLDGALLAVDHSTAGAFILIDRLQGEMRAGRATPIDAMAAQLIAYCILGHHAGLPDKHTQEAGCYVRRLDGFNAKLDPKWESEVPFDLHDLLPEHLARRIFSRGDKGYFDLSLVARFLFSCLVDADFKDTEAHYATMDGRRLDRDWSRRQDLLPAFTATLDSELAAKAAGNAALNRLRSEILAHARAKAEAGPGLFTLTVPTGGGKTLTSLAFALDHAKAHGLSRIIYAIPFTSIIDQTAKIFRDILGEEHVLEHHSAIEETAKSETSRLKRRAPDTRDRLRLAMEDWAAPVVVTTNVQFFESLFAARTSRARKLHNIAGSIIILDEAQTIPRPLLRPCVRMLDSLAHVLGCTIVLCTATQPALAQKRADGRPGFAGGLDLTPERELAPDPGALASRLRRARIKTADRMENDALVEAIDGDPQSLVIVNSRKHALELYRAARRTELEGLVHLTTRQCAAHRREILADIRSRLASGQSCRVIATSLVEAGVDLDFPRVWRAEAGLDSIIHGGADRKFQRSPDTCSMTRRFPSRGPLAPHGAASRMPTNFRPSDHHVAGVICEIGFDVSDQLIGQVLDGLTAGPGDVRGDDHIGPLGQPVEDMSVC